MEVPLGFVYFRCANVAGFVQGKMGNEWFGIDKCAREMGTENDRGRRQGRREEKNLIKRIKE